MMSENNAATSTEVVPALALALAPTEASTEAPAEVAAPTEVLQSVAGARDFYPEQFRTQQWLFNKWKTTSESFGYEQYDAPILERTSLYTRKGGDDIINEMYAFTDKDGTSVCLRPEMTPSVARMVIQIYNSTVTPIRLFSLPQCWRFETITKGRKREHYQWNADVFGGEKIYSEFETLSMAIDFFKSVGLTSSDIVVRISNRMIIQTLLIDMEIDLEKHEMLFNIIDKIKKISTEELFSMFNEKIGLNKEQIDRIIKLISISNIEEIAAHVVDESVDDTRKLFELLRANDLQDWVELDLTTVRGLSYYTGVVFEGFSKSTSIKRSVFGGGRYDDLLTKYGYPTRVPVVGYGFGDVVIIEVLKELGLMPKLSRSVDYCVISYDHELYADSCKVASKLRQKGHNVVSYMKCGRLKNAFDYANNIGAKEVVLVAPKEYREDKIIIKNMATGVQTVVELSYLD